MPSITLGRQFIAPNAPVEVVHLQSPLPAGLSNSLAVDFWLETLRQAIARFGTPVFFNTDHDLSVESTAA
jgi:hypothetical protein